ncbi:MAG TPA: electron transfer flavoprotein subunit alpha/FixB family protein, partial [Megasphaera sp.]|nr:electron transfer flavoprotein subunit alpha/FixB family protein [Megasphaera sp.]
MEKKHNIWVYIELVDGKPSQLSLELLGKGRELADSRNKALMALLAGKGAEEAASDIIGYGADVAVVVNRDGLDTFDASQYTEIVQQILTKYEASAMLIGASPA